MPRKGFPRIASMPSIRVHFLRSSDDNIPMRSIETENLNSLEATTSPYAKPLPDENVNAGNWTPISISSESSSDEDDKMDRSLRDRHQPTVVKKKEANMLKLRRKSDQYQSLKPERIVKKTGERNVESINLPQKVRLFLKDIVHTLIDAQWRWVLGTYILTYFVSWFFFSGLYYTIGWAHGDFEFDLETGKRLGEGREECIRGPTSYAGYFLLSVESQVSTGYGAWYPTEECSEAIFLLIVQLVLGVIIDASMVGVIYVKLIRPHKYAVLKFCKKAVICQRDGRMCLIFHVADFEQEHSIDSKVRAYLFEEKITLEGERVEKSQERLKLENNGRVFLIWPQTVCHPIDKASPFYDMSAKDLVEKRFELVLSLTGISRHTGQTTQVRTSYLSKEVFWGHRFTNVITYDHREGHYVAHVDKLDDIEQVDTALCSAQRLDEVLAEVNEALERETINSYQINDITEYDEEDEEEEDDTLSGLHMVQKPSESANSSRKFNIIKVNETPQ